MNEYLTEQSLRRFFSERIDEKAVFNRVIPDIGMRNRPDCRSERKKLIVEFDGWKHYTDPATIISDSEKDKATSALGYSTIRIPYFVQLSRDVVEFLFKDYATDLSEWNSFPHGFHSRGVIFPASFCELGISRFLNDLQKFSIVRNDIVNSLIVASAKFKPDIVVPPSLRNIVIEK